MSLSIDFLFILNKQSGDFAFTFQNSNNQERHDKSLYKKRWQSETSSQSREKVIQLDSTKMYGIDDDKTWAIVGISSVDPKRKKLVFETLDIILTKAKELGINNLKTDQFKVHVTSNLRYFSDGKIDPLYKNKMEIQKGQKMADDMVADQLKNLDIFKQVDDTMKENETIAIDNEKTANQVKIQAWYDKMHWTLILYGSFMILGVIGVIMLLRILF